MTALFKEFDQYDAQLKITLSLRRLCYVMTMLLSDGVYFDFFENDLFDENRARDFSERNFYHEHYERLVGIFPKARYMFNKKKLLSE